MIDWLACALVRVIGGLCCLLPPAVAVWVGEQFGQLAFFLQPQRTHIGLLNLRAAFPGAYDPSAARRIIRACYRQLGAGFMELLRLPVMDRAYIDRYVTIEGRVHFDEAMTSGRPVMFLTGHYGNWELSSIVAALNGYPIVALARTQKTLPKLYQLLISYRESKGCTIVHKGGAMKRLIAALDQGRPVGIVGDQASRQGILVDFFGRPALFATGPFELAHKKRAVLLPAFMHRVRGPYHRAVVEPPIEFGDAGAEDAAIRQGVERFADALARHIRQEPSQWLWMHKRWKHTPAKRVLVLSDGKLGHLKQSLAMVEALRASHAQMTHDVVDIRYRSSLARGLAFLWSWWAPRGAGATACLRSTLTPESAHALLSRYADLIVSCGAATLPANVLWSAANRAKSVVIMNPAPLPLGRFALIIAPRHDQLPARPNVVQTPGALVNRMLEEQLRQASEALQRHPQFRGHEPMSHRHPVIAVFIGGDTVDYEVSPAFAEDLIHDVMAAAAILNGWFLVTTSRRTSPAVEQRLTTALARVPRCRLLLLAHRDSMNGTMEGMLGSADLTLVTGESISMVSEACASGRYVVVVEPPRRRAHDGASTKHQRFLQDLDDDRYIRLTPSGELAVVIERLLTHREPAKRLDTFSTIRDAVARLL
ncbi:MAG: mitochondrial fission ELM1 family protein [Candidatus Omnitrophica bacterium]|nr:mitochondrial fission ELM1 family protein [Candidatus Omnitrophota bacterium]